MASESSIDSGIINPYIALADVLIATLLVLVFFSASVIAIGRMGQDDIRYQLNQAQFAAAVEIAFEEDERPYLDKGRNDPPGSQRWVITGDLLFEQGDATLSASGEEHLLRLADILRDRQDTWRRVRIEGHSLPPGPREGKSWDLSADRAVNAVKLLSTKGKIPSYYLSGGMRGGQNPIYPDDEDPRYELNDRIEIIVEFSRVARSQGD